MIGLINVTNNYLERLEIKLKLCKNHKYLLKNIMEEYTKKNNGNKKKNRNIYLVIHFQILTQTTSFFKKNSIDTYCKLLAFITYLAPSLCHYTFPRMIASIYW